jgi:hypothetical protein
MSDKELLPFKAINVFIEREYLEKVLKEILEGIDNFSKDDQIAFNRFFRKYVNVLGFRNPTRAPFTLQVNAYGSAFEEKDEVIPYTLTTWTKLKSDFAEIVKKWLEAEGWQNLALERTFEESEGFILDWPENLTFDMLVTQFTKSNPDVDFDRDDLILMVLWIAGKLPKD